MTQAIRIRIGCNVHPVTKAGTAHKRQKQTFPSINAAKRASRRLQMSTSGRLGCGAVATA
jgi:hypothetical protein